MWSMNEDDRKLALWLLANYMQVVANAAKGLEKASGKCAQQIERLRDEIERRRRIEAAE